MTEWDSTVDFVVVGSGGGGMVAALTAQEKGASVLLLEKQELIGGSTAMSGGVVWVPDNPVMRADGIPDSYDEAMAHFEAVVGDVGPASSFERRHAYLTAGPEMITFLQELGVGFVPFSPLGRGFLSGELRSLDDFPASDSRRALPRFQGEHSRILPQRGRETPPVKPSLRREKPH